jgi:hypothetical protein
MADRVYARVVAVAVAAGAAVLAFPALSGAATAIVRSASRSRAAVDEASPGTPYSSSQAATPSQELPARPIRR